MTRSFTAFVITPGEIYVTRDGTPYRSDETGIIHVLSAHVAEMTAMPAPKNQHGDVVGSAPAVATATQVGSTIHKGGQLTYTITE